MSVYKYYNVHFDRKCIGAHKVPTSYLCKLAQLCMYNSAIQPSKRFVYMHLSRALAGSIPIVVSDTLVAIGT